MEPAERSRQKLEEVSGSCGRPVLTHPLAVLGMLMPADIQSHVIEAVCMLQIPCDYSYSQYGGKPPLAHQQPAGRRQHGYRHSAFRQRFRGWVETRRHVDQPAASAKTYNRHLPTNNRRRRFRRRQRRTAKTLISRARSPIYSGTTNNIALHRQ